MLFTFFLYELDFLLRRIYFLHYVKTICFRPDLTDLDSNSGGMYIRIFPKISHISDMGVYRMNQQNQLVQNRVRVVLYTALEYPFCPLVENRLENLKEKKHFELEKMTSR